MKDIKITGKQLQRYIELRHKADAYLNNLIRFERMKQYDEEVKQTK